jgi:hypothetical protein
MQSFNTRTSVLVQHLSKPLPAARLSKPTLFGLHHAALARFTRVGLATEDTARLCCGIRATLGGPRFLDGSPPRWTE